MESYSRYPTGVKGKYINYYTALEKSPNPPNPSVSKIMEDQFRINFDLEVTK